MNRKLFFASALIVFFAVSTRAEVVSFCERYLKSTDRPYEMRCIASRSAFANSVRIISNESEGTESVAFFVGKKADNRNMAGSLETKITPAGRVILFKATDQLYVFEIFVLMDGETMKNAYWKVTDRKRNTHLETSQLTCYGSLWQI
jgi:hypothetical protein